MISTIRLLRDGWSRRHRAPVFPVGTQVVYQSPSAVFDACTIPGAVIPLRSRRLNAVVTDVLNFHRVIVETSSGERIRAREADLRLAGALGETAHG